MNVLWVLVFTCFDFATGAIPFMSNRYSEIVIRRDIFQDRNKDCKVSIYSYNGIDFKKMEEDNAVHRH
jgi:hypothetical protein